ncbi:MAG: hypothetical protein LR015_14520 [Verrucomicrobia bacterium]|nr:hypothetical protein [Verrucomicrobiota bacterium]
MNCSKVLSLRHHFKIILENTLFIPWTNASDTWTLATRRVWLVVGVDEVGRAENQTCEW